MRAIAVAGLLVATVATAASAARGPRASFKGKRVDSPWGASDPYGFPATRLERRYHALAYATKLREVEPRGGVVIATDSGRIIPAGDGVDRSRPRERPWTPVAAAVSQPLPAGSSLKAVASRLRDRGVSRGKAWRAAQHVPLGLPTQALAGDPNDFLLADDNMVVSYNREKGVPNWVSYRLGQDHLPGRVKRADTFPPEKRLPKGWYRPSSMDYLGYGLDPGHMVASGDRQTRAKNRRTYPYSNMLPQAPNNNQGPWVALEHYLQGLARQGYGLHIVAGGSYAGGARVIGSGVGVPDTTWKVIVVVPPGQTLESQGANVRVIAVDVPNRNDKVRKDAPWTDFRTSPAALEKYGLRFFSFVPEPLATIMRDKVDREEIPENERISGFARPRPPAPQQPSVTAGP